MNEAIDETNRSSTNADIEALTAQFHGVFSAGTIERYVAETGDRLSSALLPLFHRRFTLERLNALAQAQGKLSKDAPEILFVCVHNAGRSQMAAAILKKAAGPRVHIRTAGSEPADSINPAVIAALDEIGVDLSEEFPKPLSDEFVEAADVVITMGCGDACPVFPGKRYADWDLDDPEGLTLEQVRPIRDEIARRVGDLMTGMLDD